MQRMLSIFDYLKRYHSDIFDVISILIEVIILRRFSANEINLLLDKAKKRRPIINDFNNIMSELLGDLYVQPNLSINLIKVLREINGLDITDEHIELLINEITQKKTINKLYSYSTPMEVNRLIVGILDIQDNDEIYNPCYGIGSLFLALSRTKKTFRVYGEELDANLDRIAKLILKALKIETNNLFVNNILKNQIFPPNRKFNKIICNPPLDSLIGALDLKNNKRFSQCGFISKSTPDLSFIVNGISYLKDKGVFIVRNQLLKKISVGEKFKENICKDRLLEAIIELPKNIFPHNSADFSLMVLSNDNDSVLHVDASKFYVKDGKYNRLIKTDVILDLLASRKDTQYSRLTSLDNIDVNDLRVQNYLYERHNSISTTSIKNIGIDILRGQRVYPSSTSLVKPYINIGIVSFNEYGFIDTTNIEPSVGDANKIDLYKLRPYDILLSLRGTYPKMTIVKDSRLDMVANAGILILRAKNKEDALGLYCFLFSRYAEKKLIELYEHTDKKSIAIDELYNIELPHNFRDGAIDRFNKINDIGNKINSLYLELEKLK